MFLPATVLGQQLCVANYGERTPCCDQPWHTPGNPPADKICPFDKPICSGYVSPSTYGTCKSPGPFAEMGKVQTQNVAWSTVNLQNTYNDPVIVAAFTYYGSDESAYRIKDVTSTSFKIRVQEAPSKDNTGHATEWFYYLVVEAGDHQLADGSRISAGKVKTSKLDVNNMIGAPSSATEDIRNSAQCTQKSGTLFNTCPATGAVYCCGACSAKSPCSSNSQVPDCACTGRRWKFKKPWTSTPIVMSSIMSVNTPGWLVTRNENVRLHDFEISLQRYESHRSGELPAETIGWIAFTSRTTISDGAGAKIGTGISGAVARECSAFAQVNFGDTFSSPVAVFQFYGVAGSDPASTRIKEPTSTGAQVCAQEEGTNDAEFAHAPERMAWFVRQGAGSISEVGNPVSSCGEWVLANDGDNCDDACTRATGNKVCSDADMFGDNANVVGTSMSNTMLSLGYVCTSRTGSAAGHSPSYDVMTGQCIASTSGRASSSMSCSAAPAAGKRRLCYCCDACVPQDVTTVVKYASGAYKDGPVATATFSDANLGGMSATASNDLYIACPTSNVIRRLDITAQTIETLAGTSGASVMQRDGSPRKARFNAPQDVTWDAFTQKLYVADRGNNRVRSISMYADHREVETLVGESASGNRDGALKTARIASPDSIAWVRKLLFVGQSSDRSVRKIDLVQNTVKTIMQNSMANSIQDMFVTETTVHAMGKTPGPVIIKFDHDGGATQLVTALISPSGDSNGVGGSFQMPKAMDYYNGNLVIAAGNRIKSLDMATRNVQAFVGSTAGGNRDGASSNALFSMPSSVEFERMTGDLYIGSRNGGLRKVCKGSSPADYEAKSVCSETCNTPFSGLMNHYQCSTWVPWKNHASCKLRKRYKGM